MWHKEYKDYPIDTPLIKEKIEPSKGIIGCEMHELNGWGNTLHIYRTKVKKKGYFLLFLDSISKKLGKIFGSK